MREQCVLCGQSFEFRFHKLLCDACAEKHLSDYFSNKNRHFEDQQKLNKAFHDAQWDHLKKGVAHFFELSPDDQDKVRNFVNVNLGSESQ